MVCTYIDLYTFLDSTYTSSHLPVYTFLHQCGSFSDTLTHGRRWEFNYGSHKWWTASLPPEPQPLTLMCVLCVRFVVLSPKLKKRRKVELVSVDVIHLCIYILYLF